MIHLKSEKDILELIKKDKWMIRILKTVKELDLNDWWIGAGFVRNKIFDYLHGYNKRTKLNDIDIIYFDKDNLDEKCEDEFQRKLENINHKVHWSVTNQARMWKLNGSKPYKSAEDGLAHWNETATCIGVKLNYKNHFILTAPHGIKDLINLTIRLNPLSAHRRKEFELRLREKEWKKKWPKLKIIK